MPYYIDTNKQLYWLDLVDHEHALPNGVTPITDEQAQAIRDTNAAAQAALNASLPNPTAFTQAIKECLGGIVATNALAVACPLLLPTITAGHWDDVQELIRDAQSKSILNTTQYAAIKAAATAFNIPINLE